MLEIKKEFRKGILFVRVIGNLNKENILEFKKEVIDLINDMKICNVVFNLSSLNSIDISGINHLLYAYNMCLKMNGISMLCGVNNNIKNYIDKSNMIRISDEIQALDLIKV